MVGRKDVWVLKTFAGWKVEYGAGDLSLQHYDTEEEAIRFGTTLARQMECELFVQDRHHQIRASKNFSLNPPSPLGVHSEPTMDPLGVPNVGPATDVTAVVTRVNPT